MNQGKKKSSGNEGKKKEKKTTRWIKRASYSNATSNDEMRGTRREREREIEKTKSHCIDWNTDFLPFSLILFHFSLVYLFFLTFIYSISSFFCNAVVELLISWCSLINGNTIKFVYIVVSWSHFRCANRLFQCIVLAINPSYSCKHSIYICDWEFTLYIEPLIWLHEPKNQYVVKLWNLMNGNIKRVPLQRDPI